MAIELDHSTGGACEAIMVVGIGGGGNSIVDRIWESGLSHVDSLVVNTDQNALNKCSTPRRLLLGPETTAGLGAGNVPERGYDAAVETRAELVEALQGQDLVFLATGLGGGTGTGASPVVASAARESGALTIALVTLPFTFEGPVRRRNAELGLGALAKEVDSLIVVPNDKLLATSEHSVGIIEAFRRVDGVLQGVAEGLTELIRGEGLGIGLDLNDVRRIVAGRGRALLGTGESTGTQSLVTATAMAIGNPLTEDTNVSGAQAALIQFRSGVDLPLHAIQEAIECITSACDEEIEVIFGMSLDAAMGERVAVTVVLTGLEKNGSEPAEAPELQPPIPPPTPPPLPAELHRHAAWSEMEAPAQEIAIPGANGDAPSETDTTGRRWLSKHLRPGPFRIGLSLKDLLAPSKDFERRSQRQ